MAQPQLEFSTFHRFMVSLGAMLIVADGVAVHFFLSGSYPILENNSLIEALFAAAVVLLFLTGAFLIIFFAVKWNKRQQIEYALHDKEKTASINEMLTNAEITKRTLENLTPLTKEDKERQILQEEKECNPPDENDSRIACYAQNAENPPKKSEESSCATSKPPTATTQITQRRDSYFALAKKAEESCLKKILAKYSPTHEVVLERKDSLFFYDAVCIPKGAGNPIIFEIKTVVHSPDLLRILEKLYASMSSYNHLTGADCNGILWLVLPEERIPAEAAKIHDRLTKWQNALGLPKDKITVEILSLEALSNSNNASSAAITE